MIKIVLQNDVPKLGAAGEVITVKDGYARNYLIPAGLALKADPSNMRRLEAQRKAVESRMLREMKTHQALAIRLSRTEVIARVQTGEEDRMFGAVTSSDIASMLAEKGVEIDRRIIDLPDPIKALGVYNVPVKIHADVTAFVKLRVEKADKIES